MALYIWRGKIIILTVTSLFLLLFGIETLIGAFSLNNPLEFIMIFFSASFMILVSLVGVIYAAYQIHAHFKPKECNHNSD